MNTYESANEVDFDTVFEVHPDGSITRVEDMHAPEVMNVDAPSPDDIEISGKEGWEAWSKDRSGQYSYHGAVMHPSEYIGGSFERDLMDQPGIYCVVEVRENDGQFPEQPIGWVVLRYEGA